MSSTVPLHLRVLVGAGSFADAEAALRIVEHLPNSFCTGLGGVLIEDVDVLTACQIPDQHIVLISGTLKSAPNRAEIRTLLQADARAFQQSLAQTADLRETNWTFSQDKGDLVGSALRAAKDWDVLVLGYRPLHSIQGKVVLLKRASRPSDEMDAAALQLSHHASTDPITFFVKESPDAAQHLTPESTLQFDTLGDSLNRLKRTNAHAVLVDLRHGPVRNQTDLSRLLEAARCPVIVFGASHLHPALEHSTQIPAQHEKVNRDDDR